MEQTITCKYFAQLREICNTESEQLEIKEDTSFLDIVDLLSKKYGDVFSKRLFQVRCNGKPVSDKNTLVKANDVLFFFPPVSGG